MLRTSLVGITRTIPAKLRENGGVVPATMYPAYVKAASKGTTNYEDLENKPTINGITLVGEISLSDLGFEEAQQADIEALFED